MLSSWSVGQIWFVSLPFSVENFQLWPWKPGLKRLGWFKETKILHSICREERKTVLEVTVHDRNKTPSITHPAFTRSGIKRRSQRGRRRRGFLRKQNICYKKKLWFTRLEKEQRETFEFGLLTRQVQCSSVVLDPLSVNLTAIEDRTWWRTSLSGRWVSSWMIGNDISVCIANKCLFLCNWEWFCDWFDVCASFMSGREWSEHLGFRNMVWTGVRKKLYQLVEWTGSGCVWGAWWIILHNVFTFM